MKKVSKLKNIEKWRPCEDAVEAFRNQFDSDQTPMVNVLDWLETYPEWGCWLLPRISTRKQYLKMALFAARSVEHLSNDPRVKAANDATEAVIKKDSKQNRKKAAAAAAAATAAAAYADAAAAYTDAADADTSYKKNYTEWRKIYLALAEENK